MIKLTPKALKDQGNYVTGNNLILTVGKKNVIRVGTVTHPKK